MANIYDKAHAFAATLVQEESYIAFKELSSKINNNPEQYEKIRDYQLKQMELYERNEAREEIHQEEIEAINAAYAALLEDEDIKRLFEVERQFSLMLTDVYKIMNEPIQELAPKGSTEKEE